GKPVPEYRRWPIGCAGNPHGAYPHVPNRSLSIAVVANFRSHGANQSQASFGKLCLSGFGAQPPSKFGGWPRLSRSTPGAGLEVAEWCRRPVDGRLVLPATLMGHTLVS